MGRCIVFRYITLFILLFEINNVFCDTPAKRIIEVDIVCDSAANRRIQKRGYDPKSFLYDAIKDADFRMNSIQFSLVLVGLKIWDRRDQLDVYKSLEALTIDFGAYRANVLLPRRWSDVSIFVTGREVDGISDALGVAPLGGRCSKRSGTAVLKYDANSLSRFSDTISHELGHSLGFAHDVTQCCTDCIMWPTAHLILPSNPRYSSCSQATLAISMKEPQSECLLDGITAPFKPDGIDLCGDGTVDPGEECDCGSGCLFGCCNCCKKCKLVPGAQCYFGGCCNTGDCTLRAEGYVCGALVNAECDIEDICSGTDSKCTDIKKVDGEVCSDARNENGFCISGKCLTRNSQCSLEWGDNIYGAPDVCYASGMNPSRFANCGIDPSNGYFISCSYASKLNYLCAMLICTGVSSISDLDFQKNPKMNILITDYNCFSGNYAPFQSNKGTLFVANYTKCGDSKVCYAGDCLPISEVLPLPSKYAGPVSYCGDMKVGPAETCDCGIYQCNCCNPVTCQFVPEGGRGLYDDNCYTCDGTSVHLTEVLSSDYTGCDHGNGRCVAGKCNSLEKSCREMYGDAATPAPQNIYAGNLANTSQNNAGGYLLQDGNSQWSSTFREFYRGTADGRCGILLCKTEITTATVKDKNGFNLESKTFFLYSDANIRVAYYSFENTTKAGITYKRFHPVLSMNGTPCTTVAGLPGYCDSRFLSIDRYQWNWYWYSQCVPLPN